MANATQSTRMGKFRNKGWPPYQTMLDICPNSTARGDSSFSPSSFAPPPPGQLVLDDDEASLPGDDTSSAIYAESSNAGSSTLVSAAAEKRKLDTEDSAISISSAHSVPHTSSAISTHSSSAVESEQPRKKKMKSQPSSAAPSSSRRTSNRTSEKMTPLLLAHEMQGSVNQLTSAITTGLTIDPAAETVRKATEILQKNEDGLSDEDSIILLTVFTRDPAIVNIYNSIYKAQLRKPWVAGILSTEKRAMLIAKRKEEQEDRAMAL